MRVACVNQDPGVAPGRSKGAAVHLEAMRRAFRALGVEVCAVDHPETDEVERMLTHHRQGGGIDAIYERYSLNGVAAGRYARRWRIPHVLEVNAPLVDEARRFRSASDADPEVEGRLFRGATHVVAVSTEVAQHVVRHGADQRRVLVARNGVDVERFRPRTARDALRRELVPDGSFVLGFHGRLRPWHNFGLLVDAVVDLRRLDVPVFLMTVGRGEFGRDARRRGLAEEHHAHVDWVPHDEVGRYVACFDALPLTHSPDAPFYFSPLKLYEAMAVGAIPIVPRLGDLSRIVKDRQHGVVYPAGDRAALVTAIRGLASDPLVCGRLARSARAAAMENTWTAIARRVLDRLGGDSS